MNGGVQCVHITQLTRNRKVLLFLWETTPMATPQKKREEHDRHREVPKSWQRMHSEISLTSGDLNYQHLKRTRIYYLHI